MTHSYPVKGTYPIRLRVTDVDGFSDQTTQALAVTAKPIALAVVSPIPPELTITSLVNVKLDGSGSTDSDGEIVRYEWDLDGDGTYEVDAGNTPTIQRLFGTSGTRQVGLQVTDEYGAVDADAVTVVVENRVPVAQFTAFAGPAIVGAPTTISAAAELRPRRDDRRLRVGFRRRRDLRAARRLADGERTSSPPPAATRSTCA